MADARIVFPKVHFAEVNPESTDNTSAGYISGNLWINTLGKKVFMCVDPDAGEWQAVVLSSGSGGLEIDDNGNVRISGDITVGLNGPILRNESGILVLRAPEDDAYGTLKVENLEVLSLANLSAQTAEFGDNIIYLNSDVEETAEPVDDIGFLMNRGSQTPVQLIWSESAKRFKAGYEGSTYSIVTEGDIAPNAAQLKSGTDTIHHTGTSSLWEMNISGQSHPIVSVVRKNRNPKITDVNGFFVGQTWINTVNNQKFTCITNNGVESRWYPVTFNGLADALALLDSSLLIIYNAEDDEYTRVTLGRLTEFIHYRILGYGETPAASALQEDPVGNLVPAEAVTGGLTELDASGNFMPIDDGSVVVDDYLEVDADNDLTIKEEV